MQSKIQENIPLAPYTSWNIGGPAQFFFQPLNLLQLQQSLQWALDQRIPYEILGGGSNVLISDEGFPGLVVQMGKMSGIFDLQIHEGAISFSAWSGTSKSEILKLCLKEQFEAAMFLAGLPGDVGGGVVMNAGVAENFPIREFGQIVQKVYVWDPMTKKEKVFFHDELMWNYRHSLGWQPGVLFRVDFFISSAKDPNIVQKVREANKIRLQKQPLDMPSCGSVFMNPPGFKAAQLIDGCGLKGFRKGDAQVSTKHANFIVNLGKATAEDVAFVIRHVQSVVLQQKSVPLKTEVVPLGPVSLKISSAVKSY